MKRINFFILILFCLTLFMNGKIQKIKMGENIILSPKKMVELNGTYHVLDAKQRKIFVFDGKKFLFKYGRPGQGPGDMQSPISIAKNGGKVYCLEKLTGKVSIFSKNGKYIDCFHIEGTNEEKWLLGDFVIYNKQLVVCFNRGKTFIKFFNFNGKAISKIEKPKEVLFSFSHLYYLIIDRQEKILYVFSQYSGETILISLDSKKIIDTYRVRSSVIDKELIKLSKFDKNQMKKNFGARRSVSAFELFFQLIKKNKKIYIISRLHKRGSKVYPIYTFNSGTPSPPREINFGINEPVKFISQFGDNILIIDREGNIYKRRKL